MDEPVEQPPRTAAPPPPRASGRRAPRQGAGRAPHPPSGLTRLRADPVRRSRLKLVVVAVVGSVVTLVGVALLALPGPGFLLVAAGLGILSTQFAWARRPLRYATKKAQDGVDEVAKSPWRTAFAIACGVVPLVIGTLHYTGVRIPYLDPFVNDVTAGTLIFSGLFLIGLVVYARRTGGVGDRGTGDRD